MFNCLPSWQACKILDLDLSPSNTSLSAIPPPTNTHNDDRWSGTRSVEIIRLQIFLTSIRAIFAFLQKQGAHYSGRTSMSYRLPHVWYYWQPVSFFFGGQSRTPCIRFISFIRDPGSVYGVFIRISISTVNFFLPLRWPYCPWKFSRHIIVTVVARTTMPIRKSLQL